MPPDDNGDDEASLRRRLLTPFLFISGAVGLASGYFGIVQAGQTGDIVLRVIAAIALLFFLGRLTQFLLLDKVKHLRRGYRQLQDERDSYRGAIERLIDRQTMQYKESLEITVIIGTDDAGDKIIEKHVTTPTPSVIYRSMRPITPRNQLRPTDLKQLQLDAKSAPDNGDRGIGLTVLPIESSQGVRVLILFEPAVHEPFSWILTYNPKGLWKPLRDSRVDYLAWDARSHTGNSETAFRRVVVRFVFPEGVTDMTVSERHNIGSIDRMPNTDLGPCLVWTDDSPRGVRYEWDISMPRMSGPPGSNG